MRTYTFVVVTHNLQRAVRISDDTAFLLEREGRTGELIEYGPTNALFTSPGDERTAGYISGRFG